MKKGPHTRFSDLPSFEVIPVERQKSGKSLKRSRWDFYDTITVYQGTQAL